MPPIPLSFQGRKLIIVTMYGKERELVPILERELKVYCEVPEFYSTDNFGTFSGAVPRNESAKNTIKTKAVGVLCNTKDTLAVASEGYFGPHPNCFRIPANEEIVGLLDIKNPLFITGKFLTVKTNFGRQTINPRSFCKFGLHQ